MTNPNLLVVEDDRALRSALRRALTLEGYDVEEASDGAQGLELIMDRSFDAVILDVGLPNIDGLSLCRMLRQQGRTEPVMMLTARSEVPDRVAGLDAGADDYLVKPFSVEELLARLRAMLRRPDTAASIEARAGSGPMEVGELVLDPGSRLVTHAGCDIPLTKLEFDVLELLVRNSGLVVSREVFYDRIWGYDFETDTRALDVTISYIRNKLESGERPRVVHTVRGIGYVLRSSM